MRQGWFPAPGVRALRENSRFLHYAVAGAPAPVGMTVL